MKKCNLLYLLLLIGLVWGISSCKSNTKKDETPTRGTVTILVDETFLPMIEDQVEVFEDKYQYANIDIITQPEKDIMALLMHDSSRIAILSRDLNQNELAHFERNKIIPKVTELAIDGIALIVNKNNKDTVITIEELKLLLNGKETPGNYTLVFDNPNSSTVQYMLGLAGVEQFSATGVYSLNTNEEVIRYVSETANTIGFVGVSWLYRPAKDQQKYIDQIKVLGVGSQNVFYKPTQDDIAGGRYPFVRTIKLINCQVTAGLGLGFASFAAGDVGQRIILKSGLVPIRYPKRELKVREQV